MRPFYFMIKLKTRWTERKRISDERLNICKTCDRYNNDICKECGCIMSLKTMFPYSECPLNKWKAYIEELK